MAENKIKACTDTEYNDFVTEATISDDWEVVKQTHGSTVWNKQNNDSNIKSVRVTSFFSVPPMKLFDMLFDEKLATEFKDDIVEESTVLENIDEENTVSYCNEILFNHIVRMKSPFFFVSGRDFVTRRSLRKSKDECIVILKSVEHESKPDDQSTSYIRGHTYYNGYHCTTHEQGCKLTYLTRSDLKGYIPPMIINYVILHTLNFIDCNPNSTKID